MEIQTIKPDPALSEFIEFYYFIKNDDPDFSSKHYSFPHTVNVLSIYQNASFESKVGKASIFHDPGKPFLTLLQAKCQVPLEVNLTGKTDRISIFFKPLGINSFINGALSNHIGKTTNAFLEWDNDPGYGVMLKKCFQETGIEQRTRTLEDFLKTKLRARDFGSIPQALNLLTDFNMNYPLEDIARKVDIPLRTFNRRFKEILGVSPVEYQGIARFRHSMNNKLFADGFKKLTDIGYESNFYDQSYFIRFYRKLTGSNPKAFFNQVEKLADNRLIFQFVKS